MRKKVLQKNKYLLMILKMLVASAALRINTPPYRHAPMK